MAEIDSIVLRNARAFLTRLDSVGIPITEAYLFGSQLNGKADKWSDIDIAVVSPQFSDDRFEERVMLTKIAFSIDDRIEPLPFTPDRFVQDDPFVHVIISKGFKIEKE